MRLSHAIVAALPALAVSLPLLAAPAVVPGQDGGKRQRTTLWGSRAHMKLHPAVRYRQPPGQMAMPHLSYYGGRVLANVRIVAVYWEFNGYFASTEGQDFVAKTNAFYSAFVVSPQFDWLHEYNTTVLSANGTPSTNQAIGRGTFGGGFVIH